MADKCPECGQGIVTAKATSFGQERSFAFTARPAILYTVDGDSENPQLLRYAPTGPRTYVYHAAVCPKRERSSTESPLCSSCRAPIIWAISPLGARLPIDREPVTPYAIEAEWLDQAVELHPQAPVYISHFATCMNAAQHSTPRRPRS